MEPYVERPCVGANGFKILQVIIILSRMLNLILVPNFGSEQCISVSQYVFSGLNVASALLINAAIKIEVHQELRRVTFQGTKVFLVAPKGIVGVLVRYPIG